MKSFFGSISSNPAVSTIAPALAVSSSPSYLPSNQSPPHVTFVEPGPAAPPRTILENQTFFCGLNNELEYTGQCTYIHIRDSQKTPTVFKSIDEEEINASGYATPKFLAAHGRGVLKVRYAHDEKYLDEAVNNGVVSLLGVRDGEGEGLIQTHTHRGYHGGWYLRAEELGGKDIVVGKYRGEWKKGTLSGRGILEFHNPPPNARLPPSLPELKTTGEFMDDNAHHCRGSLIQPSGNWYSGEWVSGFFTGTADKIVPGNPLQYKGEIRNDKKFGHGEEIDPMGGRYIGYFVQDARNFSGRYIWPSGRVEEREYANGALIVRTEVDPALQESLVKDMEKQLNIATAQVQALTQELARTKAQISTLTSLVEVEKEANLCQICMENKRNSLIMPCCHFLYCNDCIRSHSERNSHSCPACRTPIGGIMQCRLTLS